MKQLHPQVRISETGIVNSGVDPEVTYSVYVYDGLEWMLDCPNMSRDRAEDRAAWLSDALRLAERSGHALVSEARTRTINRLRETFDCSESELVAAAERAQREARSAQALALVLRKVLDATSDDPGFEETWGDAEHALAVFNRGERAVTPRDMRNAVLDEVIEHLEGCHIHETRGYYVTAVRELKADCDV